MCVKALNREEIFHLPDSDDEVSVSVRLGVISLDLVEENSRYLVGLLIQLPVSHLLPSLGVDQSNAGLDFLVILNDILQELVDGDIRWMVVIFSTEVAAVGDPHSS